MAGVLSRLRDRSEVVVECRRCGTTVRPDSTTCPTCGGSGFAEYVIAG